MEFGDTKRQDGPPLYRTGKITLCSAHFTLSGMLCNSTGLGVIVFLSGLHGRL